MATNFPTALDSYTTKEVGDVISEGHINDPQDAIEAIEAKVGIDGSSDTTSLDYKVNNLLFTNVYYADYNETDQGITGNGNTIKAFVDTIGTDNGRIILSHNSGGATTTYTLTTSLTIPSNIELIIDHGAILDGDGTLTHNGSFKHDLSQCFGSSITIVGLKEGYPQWWGAKGNGTTTDTTALQKAITACNIYLPKGTYKAENVAIPSNRTIDGSWNAVVKGFTNDGTVTVFKNSDQVNGNSNITIKNIKIDGGQATQRLIEFKHVDQFIIENVWGKETAQAGSSIDIWYSTNGKIEGYYYEGNQYGLGINILDSSTDIVINNCIFDYPYDSGIDCTMAASSGTPIQRIAISNITVLKRSDLGVGYGLAIHNRAQDISISNFTIYGAKHDGIAINHESTYTAPKNISISNGTINTSGRYGITVNTANDSSNINISNVTIEGATQNGIQLAAGLVNVENISIWNTGNSGITVYGDASTSYSAISIIGCSVYNPDGYGISFTNLRDSNISNNFVKEAYYDGIGGSCANTHISNNTVKNSGQGTFAPNDDGIHLIDGTYLVSGSINNIIIGNRCYDDQGTQTQDYGMTIEGADDYNIICNNNLRGNLTGGLSGADGANNIKQNNLL